ncbi:CoA ester lyase [Salinibacterium sp. dk2585]|uniref:HpcH/HpaI aldolase/citrate lyase family protein n=1 Tax=unclassified Salinibacterium TaxID=2632331 RepID=UPI0011C24B60|nr:MULTISPECIES: CoA ester lyase [unclassified Salinibacterium]QEE61485.1 CoA ester lyase [Salinibacterium sp. dk2585]TXK54162.1 CoA ester lyase [Salinibacterium sp. dk5596]
MSTPFTMGPAILFCPADRPERFAKAAERADAVILDLEDAVGEAHKAAAREAVIASSLDPDRTILRINSTRSDHFEADLDTLARSGYSTVMVPKVMTPEELALLAPYRVVSLIESARGVLAAPEIAALPHVVGLFWGAEDLTVSLGGTSSRGADGRYRDVVRVARSNILLAARANGKAAIDAINVDFTKLDSLAAEAADAAASGFSATACIHPAQAETIRAAYRPTQEQLDWAQRVVDGAAGTQGAFSVDGAMIDEPVIRHAEALLRRAGSHERSAR